MSSHNDLTLLLLSASWCPKCGRAREELLRLSNLVFTVEIDVQKNTSAMMRYAPNGLPHFILLKNGEEIARQKGATDKLEEFILDYNNKASGPN